MLVIGIDVAKAKLDVCVLLDERKRAKVVANSNAGVIQLLAWLQQHWPEQPLSQMHAVLEGTGVYHESAACALFDVGVHVSIVNPAQVRDFAKGLGIRTKTDGVDSQVLARYGALVQPAPWTPPPAHVRTLTALLARREAIAQDLRRERNRQEKALAAQSVALVRHSLETSIAFLLQQLKDIERQIDQHIDGHPDLKGDVRLLQSIPAVGDKVGTQMTSRLRSHCFTTAEQLAAYLGLVPVERVGLFGVRQSQAVQGRACHHAGHAVHGRSGGHAPQSAHQGAVRAATGQGQEQDGCHWRGHAKAGASVLRRVEASVSLSSRFRTARLTGKTVSTASNKIRCSD